MKKFYHTVVLRAIRALSYDVASGGKIMLLRILLCAFVFRLCAYTDPELESLWSCLSDVNNPSLEDYRSIENYLQNGQRPYLDKMFKLSAKYFNLQDREYREKMFRSFKLIGANGEMPIFEVHKINVSPQTQDRCILIYASYNRLYPSKAYKLLEELKQCGYRGHVMLRIGGFPNLSDRGIKLAPFFGWKQEFFKEARRLGYTKIIHLDTSMHPLNDLNKAFEILENHGYFLLHTSWDWNKMMSIKHFIHYHIPFKDQEIPWVCGYAIGFNFNNPLISQFFEELEALMVPTNDFMTLAADEFALTALSWKYRLSPIVSMDHHICNEGDSPPDMSLPSNQSLFFFLDHVR